ncbi:MAG: NAD-dependent epimerase/dehydratase family protein [Saprospiraceae bacterium]|nr:NAD-dependent epimerase/dehydratase family protein [Saprospiraceae bacterium]
MITGATGFVGRAILIKLLEINYQVYVLVRKDSKIERIKELFPVCKFIYYETLLDTELQDALQGAHHAEFFFHVAWRGVSNLERDQFDHTTYNITLATDSIILASKLKCNKWIGIGSQAEYGIPNTTAYEDTTPLAPISVYGKAKLATYRSASELCQMFEMPMLWCRVFSLYGSNDNENNFIPYIINSCLEGNSPALTKCEQIWDYLHVKDGANAIVQPNITNASGIYNIGSGKQYALET